MNFRLRAFALHLAGSACALTLVLGTFYLCWYRWPAWYLSGVSTVVLVMCVVDVALGPSLTLIIANPKKPRRELGRDVAIIVAVQIAALVYGASALWQGRPLYYTYSNGSLDLVQASDIEPAESARARRENPAFAPSWNSRVRWVWAPLPADPAVAEKMIIDSSAGVRGADVVDMPRFFRPWHEGLADLRSHLRAVGEIKSFSDSQKSALTTRIARLGIATTQANSMVMWGLQGTRPMLVVFDPDSLEIRVILKP
jgi:hypothetical protein